MFSLAVYLRTLNTSCGMPLFAQRPALYSFLAIVRFLELALKNMFVLIIDLMEIVPQCYAPKQCYFANKVYMHYLM